VLLHLLARLLMVGALLSALRRERRERDGRRERGVTAP
jgi:hypothetical protein